MGIVEYEQLKLRQKEIEVRALVAFMKPGSTPQRKTYAEKKLCEIAFPEDHIEEIEQAKLGYCGCDFCKTAKANGMVYDLHCKEL